MTATARILAFAAHGGHILLPEALADARRLLEDTLAVGAAGAASPAAGQLRAAMAGWSGGGPCRLLGDGRASPPDAAFFNGFAIHCLEWDAVHEPAVVHAMSVVTAALLAEVDRRRCDPDMFLTALAVGVEIAAALGLAATGPMRFFRPATAGVVGAALAVGRLRGLGPARFAGLLGLAVAQAAGTMQAHVEGSVALPLQIAAAARAAVTAVDCAGAGLEGPHDALEGPFGYARLIEPLALDEVVPTPGARWRISELSTKPYPSGRASHAVLGAVQARMLAGTLAPAQLVKIEAFVPPLIARLVGRPWGAELQPAQARLCLAFLVALMLRDGRIDPRAFTDAAFDDPALRRLGDLLVLLPDGSTDPNALGPQRVLLHFADGTVEEIAIAAAPGSPAAPLGAAGSAAKLALARELAGPGLDPRLFDDPLSYCLDGSFA
jgi:2-methylcitrate dehydratase PrpD